MAYDEYSEFVRDVKVDSVPSGAGNSTVAGAATAGIGRHVGYLHFALDSSRAGNYDMEVWDIGENIQLFQFTVTLQEPNWHAPHSFYARNGLSITSPANCNGEVAVGYMDDRPDLT